MIKSDILGKTNQNSNNDKSLKELYRMQKSMINYIFKSE